MSPDGQSAVVVGDFPMPRGQWFDWHQHPDHQLVWAASGVALVRVEDGRTWVLPGGRALWLPAGLRHTTGTAVTTRLRSLYLAPERCPTRLGEATVIAVHGLLRELIGYLGSDRLSGAARRRAEGVLFDLITPLPTTAIGVPHPRDGRLLAIAAALRTEPAGRRTPAEWGRQVGASARTLARLCRAETGLTFGEWRTQLRLEAALGLLAEGMAVNRVAGRVGYRTPSAFVAAFRRVVGVPPGAYFAAGPRTGDGSRTG